MTTSTDDQTARGHVIRTAMERGAEAITTEVRARTAGVLRHIDWELEQVRRATAHRIVWDSLFAGWGDDADDLLEADLWVDMGDDYWPEEEIVLTLIDEIRLGMCPPE